MLASAVPVGLCSSIARDCGLAQGFLDVPWCLTTCGSQAARVLQVGLSVDHWRHQQEETSPLSECLCTLLYYVCHQRRRNRMSLKRWRDLPGLQRVCLQQRNGWDLTVLQPLLVPQLLTPGQLPLSGEARWKGKLLLCFSILASGANY